METKEEDCSDPEDWETSPIQVIEEAVRVAGEALQNVYSSSSNRPPTSKGTGHRRSRSEIVNSIHRRRNSFQQLKTHVRKAFRFGRNLRDENCCSFNPEILADQKRQWYQIHSKTSDYQKYCQPTSLFEHFIIAGLYPDTNLEVVEDSFARTKKLELEMNKSEIINFRMLQKRGASLPSMDPQVGHLTEAGLKVLHLGLLVIFKYPHGKRLDMRLKDLAAFCFPSGVKARVLQRTPSLTELNQLVYGQGHINRDDLSFIFSLKVADNATLYGVCLHVHEIVQKPPAIYGSSSPFSQLSVGCSRFLVAAPRCYCVLTRVPFFELHYEMLNSVVAQERLNRITQFVSEIMTVPPLPPLVPKSSDVKDKTDLQRTVTIGDWTASAIPVDCTVALAAAAAGLISDDEVPSSSSRLGSCSPESYPASEASDYYQAKEVEKDGGNYLFHVNDCAYESSENHVDSGNRMYRNYEDGHIRDIETFSSTRNWKLELHGSSGSLFSSARSVTSEDEDDDFFFSNERDVGDEVVMSWAKENKSDLLQIISSYHSTPIPERGSKIVFQPLEQLQSFEYRRLSVSALGISEKLGLRTQDPKEATKVNLKLAAAEEAASLSMWTTATICRVLSLQNVLTFVTGILLEKQVVVLCPNLGVLSAVVLSIIPIIRPFEWQSLFLPILPEKMLDFLDAPVPFIVGLQHKPACLKVKAANLVRVNLVKDQVKTCHLPHLPQYKQLISQLEPIYARLSSEYCNTQRHPVYRCSDIQVEAATEFLFVMRQYLDSLCSDLRLHTITSVQSNNDRVSILLKESFIDSFHSRDQDFVKLFVDTQLFSVLSDSHLSSYEHEHECD